MLQINEPINVWVFFEKSSIKPHTFFWQNRKIKIDKINLIHTTKQGEGVFYHFSVSGGGNFYRLRLDQKELRWFLESVDLEEG